MPVRPGYQPSAPWHDANRVCGWRLDCGGSCTGHRVTIEDRASHRRRVGTPGSFDVFLDGVVVASLVRSGPHHRATWTAELLRDSNQKDRPSPFRRLEHQFATFEEARDWLEKPPRP
jgi:hypothetical protein